MRMLSHNFNGTFPLTFNDTRWRETTMPTIFRREVVDAVWVMEIFGARRGLTRGFAGVFGGKKMRGWVGAEGALPGAQMRGTWGTRRIC